MWQFFKNKQWFLWSYLGTAAILLSTWLQVQIDVKINEWFGSFYDMIQQALGKPGSVTLESFYGFIQSFATLAGMYIVLTLSTHFFVSHWLFRWRKSMVQFYHAHLEKGRTLEGSSQRIQEDTIKFARIMETLGVGLVESVMMLIAFLPILMGLSGVVKTVPLIGEVAHSLIWVALLTSLGGTIFLALVGIKLPGIEYDIQKNEAAYRKHLVLLEDAPAPIQKDPLEHLFEKVRHIHFKSYAHYAYFNFARYGYAQAMVLVPYVALAPSIVAGVLTLGVLQQTIRAFGRVHESMQYVVKSWPTIIEIISVHKRLKEFEHALLQK